MAQIAIMIFVLMLSAAYWMWNTDSADAALVATGSSRMQMASQAGAIRSFVTGCGIAYPAGDNGTGFNPPYPAGETEQSAITCPGSGAQITLPPGWTYQNYASGVYIYSASQYGVEEAAATLGGTVVDDRLVLKIL